uniref:Uncharacterized protein n=1 Tax=Attheya septentrionalis TaxID=420275 RepID=A0A7S2UD74_9STRA|mmetsp:Transcript_20829/g.37634  ORF Transcript_20829/g.37634 Transcript_20829/m.37634 type:complete len:402 (+) Transcript_20829:137-1342(+)
MVRRRFSLVRHTTSFGNTNRGWVSVPVAFLLLSCQNGGISCLATGFVLASRIPRIPVQVSQGNYFTISSVGKGRRGRGYSSELNMALIPIPVETMGRLLSSGTLPTPAQYGAYWGRTSRETYAGLFESANVTVLGLFCAYFLSFILGQFVATLVSFVFAAWIILAPQLKAYQRNWELRGGRDLVDPWSDYDDDIAPDKRGLYGAYYFGHVVHVAVVENPIATDEDEYDIRDFQDYTMEGDELEQLMGLPYQLRLRVCDCNGRELQVHARMSEEYLDISEGMPVACVLLSTSQDFVQLAGMTDMCIPDAECWVGDYPYLDRPLFERMLANDVDETLWDALQNEGRPQNDMVDYGDSAYNMGDDSGSAVFDPRTYGDDDDDENLSDFGQEWYDRDVVRTRGKR